MKSKIMTKFDPYHQWLGIHSDNQPAKAHDILGLSSDENDADIINRESEIRGGFIRQHIRGAHAAFALALFASSNCRICIKAIYVTAL